MSGRTIHSLFVAALLSCIWTITALSPSDLLAHTPESPEVKKMLEKSLKFLETATSDRLGGKCLIGLVFVKKGFNEDHPQVKLAADACIAATRGEAENIHAAIYDQGIAVIFLCNLDPSKYNEEIRKLLKSLELRQKNHGGWGYAEKETGDTSMTQYGALSAWEAVKVGFVVPRESIVSMTNWLIRTQDPNNGWGYQGKPADTTSGRVKQDRTTLCLSTAALGSMYVAADLLGYASTTPKNDDPNLPAVLIPIVNELPPAQEGDDLIDPKDLKRAISTGHEYFVQKFDIDPKSWTYYYLYAMERYQSFREVATGNIIKEPSWYNQGVEFLIKEQKEDGSWNANKPELVGVDTAFASLFLLRSMKKSIERAQAFGAGRMAGGQRLPIDLQQAKQRTGRLVPPWQVEDAAQALKIVTSPDNPLFNTALDNIPDLAKLFKTKRVNGTVPGQEALLNAYAAAPAHSRILILRILGQMDDLRHAPVLIEALDDDSLQVRREALENLERLSKRISPQGPDALTDPAKRTKLIEDWQAWYQRLVPPTVGTTTSGTASAGTGQRLQ